ncbi:MAG: hypothetical protein AAGF79_03255 [Pseudomonadota bacterium]
MRGVTLAAGSAATANPAIAVEMTFASAARVDPTIPPMAVGHMAPYARPGQPGMCRIVGHATCHAGEAGRIMTTAGLAVLRQQTDRSGDIDPYRNAARGTGANPFRTGPIFPTCAGLKSLSWMRDATRIAVRSGTIGTQPKTSL